VFLLFLFFFPSFIVRFFSVFSFLNDARMINASSRHTSLSLLAVAISSCFYFHRADLSVFSDLRLVSLSYLRAVSPPYSPWPPLWCLLSSPCLVRCPNTSSRDAPRVFLSHGPFQVSPLPLPPSCSSALSSPLLTFIFFFCRQILPLDTAALFRFHPWYSVFVM